MYGQSPVSTPKHLMRVSIILGAVMTGLCFVLPALGGGNAFGGQLAATATVISPNGGEKLYWEEVHRIRWDAPAETDSITVSYSIDSAATWEEIASGEANDGRYDWTVPIVVTDSALVKIEAFAADTLLAEDMSDLLFRIVQDTTVEVTTPNGGEELFWAETHTIRWNAPAYTDTISISYSIDSMATWVDISTGEINDGRYTWTVPNVLSDSALVKVIAFDADTVIAEDTSDGFFRMLPDTVVTVTNPNGGEVLYWADSYGIRWNAPAHSDTVVISYSPDSAATWIEIASGETNNGYYGWTVPEVLTDSALVKVEAFYGGVAFAEDVSDNLFTIRPDTVVTLTDPNGGEVLFWGDSYAIRWTAPDHTDEIVLSYSTDSAATWTEIANGQNNDGYYGWTVPEVLTDSAMVKVEAFYMGSLINDDVSDTLFTIGPESGAQVISPNGGEEFLWLNEHNIEWTAPAYTDSVTLSYSIDSAYTWTEIASGEANDGSYKWLVPEIFSDSALVKVEAFDTDTLLAVDTSDAFFTIRPDTLAEVTSPNGGEDLYWADKHTIRWTAPAHSDTVVLSYSVDSMATWVEIASGETNDGLYSWTVPEILTDSALVKVEAYDADSLIAEDTSDDFFRMLPDTVVVVTQPNGGETLVWGDKQSVFWTAPAHTDTVVLSYSVDSLKTWVEIASGENNDGYYKWTVPEVETDSAVVKVVAFYGGVSFAEDVSDDFFTIHPDSNVQVYAPNGGEELLWANDFEITWVAPIHTDTIELSFSLDSAKTWMEIATGETNDGSYMWSVPEVYTDSAMVKVVAIDAGSPIGEDVSDTLFAIGPDTTETAVTSPNGGEELLWLNNHDITWIAPAHTDSVTISYSVDSLKTWVEIASGEANDGTYSWLVPEISTDSAMVKVEAFNADTLWAEDTSDDFFKIRPDTVAVLTSPNGGEDLLWLGTHNITWTAPAHTDTVVLSYSMDSLKTWIEIASGEANDGTYHWTVPEVTTDSAVVKIEAFDAGLIIADDTSDDFFTIRPDTVVEVTTPNGGEEITWGANYTIRWNAPAHTDTVVISYSADSDTTWIELGSGEPNDGYFLWVVPEVLTDSALVMVEAYDAGALIGTDLSDDFFTILPDTVAELRSPNGGEELIWNDSFSIFWSAPAHTDSVTLSYSVNNAATWEEIASGEPNDEFYAWTVPEVLTDSALVKVEAYYADSLIAFDVSDSLFTITSGLVDVPGRGGLGNTVILWQNAPNPLHSGTKISFYMPEPGVVDLQIFDAKGRLVDVLIDGAVRDLGVQTVSWDGRNAEGSRLSSGVYFYRLKVGDFVDTRKMILAR